MDKQQSTSKSEREFHEWHERLDAARALRSTESKRLWEPLYRFWQGRLKSNSDEPEYVNAADEFADVLLPHLVGEDRTVSVKPHRAGPGENLEEKLAFAELAGDQATALGKALGLYRDEQGRPGEFKRAVMNSFWSMGVLLFGFEQQEGNQVTRQPGNEEEMEDRPAGQVDLNFAKSDHRELHDAGMPFARCVDSRDFLADHTFKDFGRGAWCAVEYYLTEGEARVMYPDFKERWKHTHSSPPVWDESDSQSNDASKKKGKLIRFTDVYLRQPREVLTIPDLNSGVPQIVERQEYDLGIEGLPVLLIGHKWVERDPYPIPLFARIYDAGQAENEHMATVESAASKLKVGMMVDGERAPKLAEQLRQGDDQGVYENDGPVDDTIVRKIEIGDIRPEHLELMDRNRQSFERASGISDFSLGRREPGDPTLGETEMRQAHISMRLTGRSDPVKAGEAEMYRRLLAVAYAKIGLLHGLQLPVDEARFVAFDATRPAVGELSDYTFEVEVQNALTSADEVNQINNVLQLIPQFAEMAAAEGKAIRVTPLLEQFLEKSRVRGKEEIIVDLPPQQPQPGQEQVAGQQTAEPQAELEQIWAQLQQVPDGDPAEEQLLQRAAELQAQIEAAPAAA